MSYPLLYEINTRCWLRQLSDRSGTPVTLANVPESELAEWRRLGLTHIWLMGVWAGGARARAQALAGPGQRQGYSAALPGWREEDVGGSPYAIAEYRVPAALGGEEGLKEFRRRLHEKGLKLLLDFVPNHLGLDHPWVRQRPELFVQGRGHVPETFPQQTAAGFRWLAHGKDPNFAAWSDTVQLDYRRPETQAAMIELLKSVASRCDGVRCDMAILLLKDVFARTWQRFPPAGQASSFSSEPNDNSRTRTTETLSGAGYSETQPVGEFWADAIAATRRTHPGLVFLAEAYWGLEGRLQALGFDYTYDKTLYDKLIARDAIGVQRHLLEMRPESLAVGAHFLENHDEPRIASLLAPAEHRAAALLILGLPGLRLLHEGQLEGWLRKAPVQLLRRLSEPAQPEIRSMYEQLLTTLSASAVGQGSSQLLAPRAAWPDNPTAQNLILVRWQSQPPAFQLVAVNLAPHRSQGYAPLGLPGLSAHNWSMKDLLGQEQYVRSGDDLQAQGLYLDLPAHGAQLFHFEPSV